MDADALPDALKKQIAAGKVDLDDPATTIALLKLNAVVGVTAFANPDGSVKSMGIQCASATRPSTIRSRPASASGSTAGPNRDLNVGAIVSLAPNLKPFTDLLGVDVATGEEGARQLGPGPLRRGARQGWQGPSPRRQAGWNAHPARVRPGRREPRTWTGFGSVTYWNAYVAGTQMHGAATFFDARFNNKDQYPVSAKSGAGNVRDNAGQDHPQTGSTSLLSALAPGSEGTGRVIRQGCIRTRKAIFNGNGKCATCHVPPLFTEPGYNLHTPGEMGIDSFQADRSPTHMYRTAPLAGLWTHQKGGFFHDGRFATLLDVVNHYDAQFKLNLSDANKKDLVEYLKGI